jgi:hypothetical protein
MNATQVIDLGAVHSEPEGPGFRHRADDYIQGIDDEVLANKNSNGEVDH